MDKTGDIEARNVALPHLVNDVVARFSWENLEVFAKDRARKRSQPILSASSGIARGGEMMAIMGPSGSGKTTLLNEISYRHANGGITSSAGSILVNDRAPSKQETRDLLAYVEQDDALIGSLTVKETMMFAARLSLPSALTKKEMMRRIDDLILAFGLKDQENVLVGTPIRRGLSGGQKKRLSVASKLLTNPRILVLDEPTSGLDSALSYEVMRYLRDVCRKNNLVVIASIHQPSTAILQQFDQLVVLSRGRTCYVGLVENACSYFERIGYRLPPLTSPAEFILRIVNTDLDSSIEAEERLRHISETWRESPEFEALLQSVNQTIVPAEGDVIQRRTRPVGFLSVTIAMLHRLWIKSYRDVVVYGIRVAMYMGLATMMGTVFLRLGDEQKYIQPFINAIFFGGAFMSFMAVAYVPAFLEDLHTFEKERENGIAGPGPFLVANFVIGVPFLFLITVLFSAISYWLGGFRSSGQAFMMWNLWLFLDLLAAESLVVLVSVIAPVFVVALAITAFANGLWMCVGGFLVPLDILNVFWKYVFHYIDYQAYVFKGMMVNEFEERTYRCSTADDGSWACMYVSPLNSDGKIGGDAVLDALDIQTGHEARWLAIMVGIVAGYRVLAYLVLRFARS